MTLPANDFIGPPTLATVQNNQQLLLTPRKYATYNQAILAQTSAYYRAYEHSLQAARGAYFTLHVPGEGLLSFVTERALNWWIRTHPESFRSVVKAGAKVLPYVRWPALVNDVKRYFTGMYSSGTLSHKRDFEGIRGGYDAGGNPVNTPYTDHSGDVYSGSSSYAGNM